MECLNSLIKTKLLVPSHLKQFKNASFELVFAVLNDYLNNDLKINRRKYLNESINK